MDKKQAQSMMPGGFNTLKTKKSNFIVETESTAEGSVP
jgi:hypothetical protein